MRATIAFIPGDRPSFSHLLSRYLPQTPSGVAKAWLSEIAPPGTWVIDPFGFSPIIPIEAAEAGYRVLVVANNPIIRFLLELTASPPDETELRNALAKLSITRVGEKRLEPFIKSIYSTTCEQCGQTIIADAFLWEREASQPYARLYHCPHCRDEGERAVTKEDIIQARQYLESKLHQARALELIASPNDPYRPYAQDALSAYLPRAIYVLFTIKNCIARLSPMYGERETREQQCLNALFLHALDQANTLWAHPTGRTRPRQMTTPPRFRENNIWFALEEAISILTTPKTKIPLSIFPHLPPVSGGIVIFEGRLRELVDMLIASTTGGIRPQVVLTAIPRYNQAFYTLSALWAGWLWGRHAVNPFRGLLKRRRYDWSWYTNALFNAFRNLAMLVDFDTPFLGLLSESEPSFFASVLIAATLAGFHLRGAALRVEKDQAQIYWTRDKGQLSPTTKNNEQNLEKTIVHAALSYLAERAEPSPFPSLHAAIMCELVVENLLPISKDKSPASIFVHSQESVERVLTKHPSLIRYGGSEKSLDVGLWWQKEWLSQPLEPLSDRVELLVLQYLRAQQVCSFSEVEAWLCKQLPGMLTPDAELIRACLLSYGKPGISENEIWHLREEDREEIRQADTTYTINLLHNIGHRLGFVSQGENPVVWLDDSSLPTYTFFVTATAALGKIIYTPQFSPWQCFIVIPGGRANLVFYKIHHNPYLQERLASGWHFLKFRHVRRLADNMSLTRENFVEQMGSDPLTDTAHQMRLW